MELNIVRYFVGLPGTALLLLGVALPASAQDASCKIEHPAKLPVSVYNITVKKDGGPCIISQEAPAGARRRGAWEFAKIVTSPQHGTGAVTTENQGNIAKFTYSPAKGYVGSDMFAGELQSTQPWQQHFNITVTP